MSLFCNKYGKECPNATPQAQSYNCDAWDPRDFLADKTCRHGQRVDSIEKAQEQWLERNKLRAMPKRKPIETPEQPQADAAKQELIRQRLELEQRQTAALEKIAEIMGNIAPMICKALTAIIDFCGDDDACEHCDWATCPKEEDDADRD